MLEVLFDLFFECIRAVLLTLSYGLAAVFCVAILWTFLIAVGKTGQKRGQKKRQSGGNGEALSFQVMRKDDE